MLKSLEVKNFRVVGEESVAFGFSRGFTAFVGPNNSGKSSLLRLPFELRNYFLRLSDPNELLNAMKGSRSFGGFQGVTEQSDVFNDRTSEPIELTMVMEPPDVPMAAQSVSRIRLTIAPDQSCKVTIDSPKGVDHGALEVRNQEALAGGGTELLISSVLEEMKRLAGAIYIGPFRNAVNVGGGADYYDMKIGSAAIDAWRQMKTGDQKRGHRAVASITADIKELFDFRELEIDAAASNQTLRLAVDGRTYWLPEVGAGMSHFILVLITLAFNQGQLALIDEPELNLHPALQAKFVTSLQKYANAGVAFATHSFGLAREVADEIFTVRSMEDGVKVEELASTRSLAELLGEMSFSGYRELGYDTVLLVEGPTDIKTYKEFLRILSREGSTVVLSLGGDDLIGQHRQEEVAELTRLAGRIVAIVDSARGAAQDPPKANRIAFREICEHLKIPCHILEFRATENYFSDRAVKKAKGEKFSEVGPFGKLVGQQAWPKNQNWLIAREMTAEELLATDLGSFLANELPESR